MAITCIYIYIYMDACYVGTFCIYVYVVWYALYMHVSLCLNECVLMYVMLYVYVYIYIYVTRKSRTSLKQIFAELFWPSPK